MSNGKWHGGKGDRRRTTADDRKYRDGWNRIFSNGESVNGRGSKEETSKED